MFDVKLLENRNLHFEQFIRMFVSYLQGEDGKKGKKKKSADLVELPFDVSLPGNNEVDLQRYREEEVRNIDFY